ncbi:tRNA (adenosine(37)-N6)-threonylcarbamoyltransferase complex dimerization subunit type 1 TsaB [Ureibacillus sp. 179-F W5.1 NHS]|uniref:tRNA (Adenosine(37)-N6)-threonylcarbamoyltransferase complex dimerization subunit type 1 TsaB n=1 Tax=Lysinibacillus halotolerans TaxID=1368476 RepID=A0A3M8H1L6_9BACI|nr:tRNA (adenosine(37)-N6)-threonylcarbamoyltransferase complex dimerization subunit type 1 TsaB [Lysinibacillus halotolerans]RNC96335.1 tRNA (adenosine(37)-N6)-threonylcarbamoyltransferase complex dimerization subunit type 1 TsaB [Lysinibacillus halotolerans]
MIWLGIETSNSPLSIAIVKDGQVLVEIVENVKLTHSVTAMPAIQELFSKAKLKPADIDAIAVSEGPGSYTGIRIGVTIAKTLAWTLKKPLVGVSSLKTLAANGELFNGIICSLFDARRQNVYAGVYQGWELETVMEERHVSIDDLLSQLHSLNKLVLFIGADVEIFKDKMIEKLGEHAIFAPSTIALPRASKLIAIAETKPLPSIEEVHHFVPQYHRLAQAEANWIQDQKKGQ